MPTAVVVIVGDEILGGHTQDTNSHYLANRLVGRGVDLRRIVTIPDETEGITATLEHELAQRPDFIFVCGGIGPTPDDRTYEGVAMALGMPLAIDPADERWMRKRIAATGYGGDLIDDPSKREGLLRMIRRPEGSAVIDNPSGAALGSAIAHGPTTVFVLPGVPRELRAMMEQVIEPRFFRTAARGRAVVELEYVGQEASLYALLRDVETLFPDVKLGSYPQDQRGLIVLRLKGPAERVEAAARRIEVAIRARRR